MEHVVHQNDRPVKGPDRARLVGQGGVEGVGFDGAAAEVRLVDLVGVEGFCHRVRHRHPPQDLAEGHADAIAQGRRGGGLGGHAVAGCDALQQPLVDHPCGHGQHQAPRIQLRQGPLEPPVGVGYGGQHPGAGGQGGLDAGVHVAGEHNGAAHIHRQQLLVPAAHRGGDKALEGEDLPDIGRHGLGGAEEGIGVLLPQGQGDHLRQQQLAQIQLLRAPGHVDAADDQRPAPGLLAHEAAQLGAAQAGEELVGVQASETGEAQHRPRLPLAQQEQVVPQLPQPGAQAGAVRVGGQDRLGEQRLRLP